MNKVLTKVILKTIPILARFDHSFLGLEKILTDNRAQYGATKDQMNDFKMDLIKADHENSIQSYIRDFCRLYR